MIFALHVFALISALALAVGAIGLACIVGMSDWHGGLRLTMDRPMRRRLAHARFVCSSGAAGLIMTHLVGV